MKDDNFKFEEQINILEQIVASLDEGELPLDKLLEQYKEGMLVAKRCRQFLDSAQQVVTEINKETQTITDENDSDDDADSSDSNENTFDDEARFDSISED